MVLQNVVTYEDEDNFEEHVSQMKFISPKEVFVMSTYTYDKHESHDRDMPFWWSGLAAKSKGIVHFVKQAPKLAPMYFEMLRTFLDIEPLEIRAPCVHHIRFKNGCHAETNLNYLH